MKRILIAILFVFVSASHCYAQNTTVTATVKDPNLQPYVFSTGYAALVCPGNQAPTYNGYSVPRTFAITGLDGTGTFTQVVYNVAVLDPLGCGYQWHITYKDGVTTFITGTITTVTGSAVNESAAISAYAVLLPIAPAGTPGGSSGQLQYNNSGTFGGVLGSAVTAATGAIALTAAADTTTPLAIASHSATQSATELDVNNQSSKSPDTPVVFRGRGFGSFTPAGNAALVHLIQESNATGHDALIVSNHTADVAKGSANISLGLLAVDDSGLFSACGGGAVGDSGTNNYSCFFWTATDGIVEACSNAAACPAVVPFAVRAATSQTADIFDILNSSSAVLASFDNNGNLHLPAGAATQVICSSQIALTTGSINSGARATNTLSCTGLSTSTDSISCTFSGDTNAVTGYAPSASGGITLKTWVSTDTVNVDQVNNTASPITPGAATVNCKGLR